MEYDWVSSQFGRNRNRREVNYRKYVNEAVQGSENPLRNIFGQTLLGGEGFIKRVREFLKGKPLPSEITARKEYTHYPSLREIVKRVSEAFAVEEGKVLLRKFHSARNVALYLAHKYSGLNNAEIGKFFGGIQSSSVSQAARRIGEKVGSDKGLTKIVQKLESLLKV